MSGHGRPGLADPGSGPSPNLPARARRTDDDSRLLRPYRHQVAEAAPEIVDILGRGRVDEVVDPADDKTRSRLEAVLADPALAAVIGSAEACGSQLLDEAARFEPALRTSVPDLETYVRMFLLCQIDALWWGHETPFRTDAEVHTSDDLVDVEPLRRAGHLGFRYRLQPSGWVGRGRSWCRRQFLPGRQPQTAGLRFTRTRPECVALLNRLSSDCRRRIGRSQPALWVTSLTRSVEHQHHLRSLGYSAIVPSAHCSGHAMDLEIHWFRQLGVAEVLISLLLEYQEAGLLNAIDEGQAWHICVHPAALETLRADYRALVGS